MQRPIDNISPYSTGNTGASLTSTAVAPMTASSVALFDEEELMYDEISTVKKEKDLAKKRAYVRMVTNLGGSLNLELFCEKVCSSNLPLRSGPFLLNTFVHTPGSQNLLQFPDARPSRKI